MKEQSEKEDPIVTTPGGPRLRSFTHAVHPGMVLRADYAGRMSPVASTDKIPFTRQLELSADPELVLTPGGFQPRSRVRAIQPGHVLRETDEGVDAVNLETGHTTYSVLRGNIQEMADRLPSLGSGWISTAVWNNTTGHPVTEFRTTWIVPPPPTLVENPNTQTIFLFNGIENFGAVIGILQPVLQWGPSADPNGGPFWTVASWYVTSDHQAHYTPLVRVNPGDTLIGVMRMTNTANGKFDYDCEFEGIAGTKLSVQNIAELVWCNETLEAYLVQHCDNYPDCDRTEFTAISLSTEVGTPSVMWTPDPKVTDCGQTVYAVVNSGMDGEVDIYYAEPRVYVEKRLFVTPVGDRWLHAELSVSRREGIKDYTRAQGYVSYDEDGLQYAQVDKFSVTVDGDGPYELIYTTGVSTPLFTATAGGHTVEVSAQGPDMGPLSVTSPS